METLEAEEFKHNFRRDLNKIKDATTEYLHTRPTPQGVCYYCLDSYSDQLIHAISLSGGRHDDLYLIDSHDKIHQAINGYKLLENKHQSQGEFQICKHVLKRHLTDEMLIIFRTGIHMLPCFTESWWLLKDVNPIPEYKLDELDEVNALKMFMDPTGKKYL